jgi:hypothetical protein
LFGNIVLSLSSHNVAIVKDYGVPLLMDDFRIFISKFVHPGGPSFASRINLPPSCIKKKHNVNVGDLPGLRLSAHYRLFDRPTV